MAKRVEDPGGFNAPMHNAGNYVISWDFAAGWPARQKQWGRYLPGFAAASILYDDVGAVAGITTGDMGINAQEKKTRFYPV